MNADSKDHPEYVVWLMGHPGSGKTSVANRLVDGRMLKKPTIVIEQDRYSPAILDILDRGSYGCIDEIRMLALIAKNLSGDGLPVIVCTGLLTPEQGGCVSRILDRSLLAFRMAASLDVCLERVFNSTASDGQKGGRMERLSPEDSMEKVDMDLVLAMYHKQIPPSLSPEEAAAMITDCFFKKPFDRRFGE